MASVVTRRGLFAAGLAPVAAAAPSKPEMRAGVGRVKITPSQPMWLSGYAARTRPAEGVLTDLWAKALALEDRKGYRVVTVTVDLIALPRAITDEVSARVEKQYGLRRAQLLFNASHTHTGPVVRANLMTMYQLDEEQRRRIEEYGRALPDHLMNVIGAALGDLAPVTLHYGQGTAKFAINRREFKPGGAVVIGLSEKGPTDHTVPVVEVRAADGRKKAILFAYTCHNTTLTAEHLKFSGDYAGFAQAEIESRYPGTTALFVLQCGADQNPNPRTKLEHAIAHGKELAGAVAAALEGKLEPVRGPIRAAMQMINLPFRLHTREQFEAEAKDPDRFKAARAREMLNAYDRGRPVRSIPYPVQAIRFDNDLTLVALGGEVVIDYQLRARREFPRERLIVAGYSNDVMCYIPSRRVLKEGGYEAESSMIYYGQPAPLTEDVEDLIFAALGRVMKRAGAKV